MLYLALALSGFLGIVHFFGEELDERISKNSLLLASFSAGFTVSYFFLVMLPEMAAASINISNQFFFALVGFSLLYVVEEFVYEKESNLSQVKKDFKEVHTLFISSYHFMTGFLLYFLIIEEISQALLFYIPILMHSAINSVAISEMHQEILDKRWIKLSASFSAVIGVMASYILTPSPITAYSIFGVIGGMFLYVVVHDALDPQRERPIGFLAGIISFLSLLAFI